MSINVVDTTPVINDYIPVDNCDSYVANNDIHGSNYLDGFSTNNESFSNKDDDDSAFCLMNNLLLMTDHCVNKN
jgi:hypothetical protein